MVVNIYDLINIYDYINIYGLRFKNTGAIYFLVSYLQSFMN